MTSLKGIAALFAKINSSQLCLATIMENSVTGSEPFSVTQEIIEHPERFPNMAKNVDGSGNK